MLNWDDCYDSPVKIVVGAMTQQIEDDAMKVIQQCRVDVDKEELIKALNYDREQYRKGFEDGRKSAEEEFRELMGVIN